MGFNPFQPHKQDFADIAMLVGAVVVILGLVLWAILG